MYWTCRNVGCKASVTTKEVKIIKVCGQRINDFVDLQAKHIATCKPLSEKDMVMMSHKLVSKTACLKIMSHQAKLIMKSKQNYVKKCLWFIKYHPELFQNWATKIDMKNMFYNASIIPACRDVTTFEYKGKY